MSLHPIVVLEGADCAGKTTLAKYLSKQYGFRHIHLTYRFKDKMFTYHHAAMELVLKYAEKGPVVLDRWWPSEVIYADEFRGGSKWPLAHRFFDRVAIANNFVYVWCIPSDREGHRKRFTKMKETGREMYDHLGGLMDAYSEMYSRYKNRRRHILYDLDTQGHDLESFAQHISDTYYFNMFWPDFGPDVKTRDWAGNAENPKYVFVGEQSNPKTRRPVWPFFEYGNSSLWMASALEAGRVPEHQILWVNALRNNREIDISGLLNLGQYVVTLGTPAYNAVMRRTRRGVINLTHPQYNRRFRPREVSDYIMLGGLP